jgi:L-cysteine desulfidase
MMSATTLLIVNAICSFVGAAAGAFAGVLWYIIRLDKEDKP